MREVILGRLWIGNALDVDDTRKVVSAGIEAIVDLALQETPPVMMRESVYLRFPLNDGGGNSPEVIRTAIETVSSLLLREIPTLVFCSAGMSRSPAVAAFALGVSTDRHPRDCIAEILQDGPRDVSPVLWQSLEDVYDQMLLDR